METNHLNESETKALAEREELFRYADLNHPLIAMLFAEASIDMTSCLSFFLINTFNFAAPSAILLMVFLNESLLSFSVILFSAFDNNKC